MNFFDAQEAARTRTGLLVTLFILAVLSLVALANLAVVAFVAVSGNQAGVPATEALATMDRWLFVDVTIGVLTVVLLGSVYKIAALSGGGRVVAESVGGVQVLPEKATPLQRQLLNVVEEIAIASGVPVPPVFILPERGINAFAAGTTPDNAAIAVTRGTLDSLSRDELQGVIAHEFSHIVNGDMRINIRLIGILHGLTVIGMIGYYIIRMGMGGRRNKGSLPLGALGVAMMVIGYGGTVFGGLIKAAVSRQREYLADAAAVQFTRNPHGIAGALKKIGASTVGSHMLHAGASQISHALFASGVGRFMGGLSATHPPLADRIRRIEPRWDGTFPSIHAVAAPATPTPHLDQHEQHPFTGPAVAVATAMEAARMIDQAGNPGAAHLVRARKMLAELPDAVREALHDPFGARAVIYALLLSPQEKEWQLQLHHLAQHGDTGIGPLTEKMYPAVSALGPEFRLPLVDLAMPALHRLSPRQYKMFRGNLRALITMDHQVFLFEWVLMKTVLHHLAPRFERVEHPSGSRTVSTRKMSRQVSVVLSMLAWADGAKGRNAEAHFAAGRDFLSESSLRLIPQKELTFGELDRSLDQLASVRPLFKRRLLHAFAATIHADGTVSTAEGELLRVIADAMGCPMPPLAAGLAPVTAALPSTASA
ncbi:MAG: M48 family metallopeptidase [Nitrospirota bacterium]|nr:M48 family metallopeptidase [Nitrospirota bacterium]